MDVCVCLFVFGHTVLYSMLHVPGVIKKRLPLACSTVNNSCSAKQTIAILSINNRVSRLSRLSRVITRSIISTSCSILLSLSRDRYARGDRIFTSRLICYIHVYILYVSLFIGLDFGPWSDYERYFIDN